MKRIVLFLSLSIVVIACNKRRITDTSPDTYTPGYLLIEYKDSTSIQAATQLCYDEHFAVHEMGGFEFYSDLPPDSIQVIKDVLLSRDYIDKNYSNAVSTIANTTQVTVSGLTFWDVTPDEMADWTLLESRLKLTPHFYQVNNEQIAYGAITVQVPEGSEEQYIKSLPQKYKDILRVSRAIKF